MTASGQHIDNIWRDFIEISIQFLKILLKYMKYHVKNIEIEFGINKIVIQLFAHKRSK